MYICVIIARKGSTRLPNKNMKDFGEKPLLQHTIEQAVNSQLFDKIIISSDYESIPSENYIWYPRPQELCGKDISAEAVVIDALKEYPDGIDVCLLLPTTPLRSIADIIEAYKKYLLLFPSALVSVSENSLMPNGALYIIKLGTLREANSFYPKGTVLFRMPVNRSIDINYYWEFRVAEALYNERQEREQ